MLIKRQATSSHQRSLTKRSPKRRKFILGAAWARRLQAGHPDWLWSSRAASAPVNPNDNPFKTSEAQTPYNDIQLQQLRVWTDNIRRGRLRGSP